MKRNRSIEDISDASLGARKSNAPDCKTFKEFITDHARVAGRDGAAVPFSMQGRAPLALITDWLDKFLRNTLDADTVEIDGVEFAPHKLKGGSVAVGGGAQFGKTILELNLMAYCTAIRFISVGNYLPDREKVEEIVTQKFRPNVTDLYPWMAEMIQLGKTVNESGKTVDRKQSYQVSDGARKAFGNFCGMHKPPTSITIDLALLDEVDDISDKNIGYVDGRMTNSPLHLTCFIGTQRVAGAGQNARLKSSSFHVCLYECPECAKEWNLEENFPRIIRLREGSAAGPAAIRGGSPRIRSTILTAEMGHDRDAYYYCACPDCGAELDRDAGRYVAKHPERVKEAKLGVRVSQLNISTISLQEIVGAWFSAMTDPSGEAMQAFYCDRIGIPNAGAAQPIVQKVLDDCRALGLGSPETPGRYAMSLASLPSLSSSVRVAGMDMGPRCWFWCDEIPDHLISACIWAELIASGNAPTRLPILMNTLGISCVFLDAGGEPDLTKRLVLALNGLENYLPPVLPKNELLKAHLSNLGLGITWDGARGRWQGIRAAAVLFVSGEAKGIEQTIGFTQEGKLYPLIKCNRAESIQTAVNDFLTPAEGVLEMLGTGTGSAGGPPALPGGAPGKSIRQLPRVRLPQTYIGPGVSQAIFDGHLLNLRKEKDVKTGVEDWIEGVENHLGLAKVYARLAATVGATTKAAPFAYQPVIAQRGEGVERKGVLM